MVHNNDLQYHRCTPVVSLYKKRTPTRYFDRFKRETSKWKTREVVPNVKTRGSPGDSGVFYSSFVMSLISTPPSHVSLEDSGPR